MRDIKKKTWSPPQMKCFEDAEEVLEHYKTMGTPEQQARLRRMLDARAVRSKPNLRRAS